MRATERIPSDFTCSTSLPSRFAPVQQRVFAMEVKVDEPVFRGGGRSVGGYNILGTIDGFVHELYHPYGS